jgi:hypothetical protein
MGLAMIKLSENAQDLAFARVVDGKVISDKSAFHCWIETDKNLIDLTAPEYHESIRMLGGDFKVPRKIFQKSKLEMLSYPDELSRAGDFYFERNTSLTQLLLAKMDANPRTQGMKEVAKHLWSQTVKNNATIYLNDQFDEQIELTMTGSNIYEKW